MTPLGSGFNSWFPLFILLPVLFSLFSLYDKVKGIVGLGDFGGWIIEDDEDEDRGEIISVVEGRGILKRELGLSGGGAGHIATRRAARQGRVLGTERVRPQYTDIPDSDDEGGENFFVATGHRLWNSISNRVDDLRTDDSDGQRAADDEDGGLLGKVTRPRWMQRGESGTSVWRLPRWGKNNDEGRVVL